MTQSRPPVLYFLIAAIFCLAALPQRGAAQDDTDLFGSSAAANVMLLVDNSLSMRRIVSHPDYDPDFVGTNPACMVPTTSSDVRSVPFGVTSLNASLCPGVAGSEITIYGDPRVTATTFYSLHYLYWLWEGASATVRQEVTLYDNGAYANSCQVNWAGQATYALYIRARITIIKDVLGEILCAERNQGSIRVGLATFRRANTVSATFTRFNGSTVTTSVSSLQGGYVVVPIRDLASTTPYRLHSGTTAMRTQFEQLREAVTGIQPAGQTPLSESLFDIYRYFMSRDPAQTVPGTVAGSRFPIYRFNNRPGDPSAAPPTSDGAFASGGTDVPPDPVMAGCQPNFVVVLTDGFPTADTFTVPDDPRVQPLATSAVPTALQGQVVGWDQITDLVPDAPDYTGEVARCRAGLRSIDGRSQECFLRSGAGATGQYDILLDDIAAVMATEDLRPDLSGMQLLRTSTIAFAAGDDANALLARTAELGGGVSFVATQVQEIRDGLTNTFRSFRAGSQSFSAPLIPAVTRSMGTSLFQAYFEPTAQSAFWEGHLEHRLLTLAGDTSTLHWDAGLALRGVAPGSRDLRVSARQTTPGVTLPPLLPTGIPRNFVFPAAAQYNGFGTPSPNPTGFDSTDQDSVYEASIHVMRGCVYPTGGATCVRRASLLGDIFHSRPVLVGEPRGLSTEPSYQAFRGLHRLRERRVYVGANDGFVHAFEAGNRSTPLAPYSAGSGAERFGFMPWPVRLAIPDFVRAISTGNPVHRFFVDGSPAASDAWFYNNDLNITDKRADGSEWHTVLIGGLRRGGEAYYALDITTAQATGTPGANARYLWEFPVEGGPHNPYVAQTWGRPIIAKVEVFLNSQVHERWVAVLTGGYDPSGDPHRTEYSALGQEGRSLYLIDIKTGRVLGQKRLRFATEPGITAGDPRTEMQYAIASTPAVFDIDSDDFADVIYVGDLGGNVWKWVIGRRDDNHLVDAANDSGVDVSQPDTQFYLFFSAKASATSSLGVTHGGQNYFHSFFYPPAGVLRGSELWLAMATGERAHLQRAAGPADTTTTADNNRFYMVIDRNPYDALRIPANGIRPAGPTEVTESDLTDVSMLTTCPAIAASQQGYYFLAENGEKFSTDILVTRFRAFVGSYLPGTVADACGLQPGQGYLYNVRLQCGEGLIGGSNPVSRGGRRSSTGGGVPNTPRRTVHLPDGSSRIYHNTSSDNMLQTGAGPGGYGEGVGQLYWRQPEE